MLTTTIRSDFTVVGGGLAGACAAIAAARADASVTLVQDRPVLGGNSSSEVRLCALGAANSKVFTRYAREGGIMEELFMENLYRNPEGNPVIWDALLVEWVTREPNITLLLDTGAYELDLDDDGAIRSVTAFCSPAQTTYVLRSPLYLDASGDGILGFLAGAEFRIGRESRSEFGEYMAPEQPDNQVLGSTISFATKRLEHPVKYVKPAFALDISETNIPKYREIDSFQYGGHFWWIEYGGMLDTIHDHHYIKHHLWQLAYGIWDYIKNSGTYPSDVVDNLTLEWVGTIPGKRESRRFIGDYILNEGDVLGQTVFPDTVASGGWSLDLHPSEGVYGEGSPAWQLYSEGMFGIPYRTMYSKNVPNLFLSGRLISASHVAFGATRVIATGAAMGQSVGTAAALCIEEDLLPRDLSTGEPLRELQRRLLKDDHYLPLVRNEDSSDLARTANVSASSSAKLEGTREIPGDNLPEGGQPLDKRWSIQIPLSDALDTISLLIDVTADTTLEWSVWSNDRTVNFVPTDCIKSGTGDVATGDGQWIDIPVTTNLAGENCWIVLEPNEAIRLHATADVPAGVLTSSEREKHEEARVPWWIPEKWNAVFRVSPAQSVWEPSNIIDGYARPHILPRIWVSDVMESESPEYTELTWSETKTVRQVRIVTNTDVNIPIYTLRGPYLYRAIPQCVADFTIQVNLDGVWTTVAEVHDNHHRHVVADFDPVETDAVRIVCEATHGHDRCELYEVRVY
jgi:hypothetical protein